MTEVTVAAHARIVLRLRERGHTLAQVRELKGFSEPTELFVAVQGGE